ncbi:MAG: hypothetical protein M3O21_05210, partial [Chloroflexota bacterium]|nr:hypothetical protein [Chloroflexota bacterium]
FCTLLWRCRFWPDGAPSALQFSDTLADKNHRWASGLAVDEQPGRVYVATWTGDSVVAVGADGTIFATIDTPSSVEPSWGPEAVAFDPVTRRVFSVETNGDVTVIDATTDSVIRKLNFDQGSAWPMSASIAIDKSARRVISSMRFSPDKLVAINPDTLEKTATFPKSRADLGLAVNETTHMVYTGTGRKHLSPRLI